MFLSWCWLLLMVELICWNTPAKYSYHGVTKRCRDYIINRSLRVLPLFFHDFQIPKAVSPIGLKFLSQIDHLIWWDTCSRKKFSKAVFIVFYKKLWFSIGPHLHTVRAHQNLSDLTENFFGDTYNYISELVLSFFKNLTFFFFL